MATTTHTTKLPVRLARLLALGTGVGALLLGTAGAASADPAGNNGTVKVDGVDFDAHPNNEPHVGCTFEVDFYGFDEGDHYADVTFEAKPPTLPESGQELLLTDNVFIGEDSNAGGASEDGLDAHREYDLAPYLQAITPHPQQGWHVKLTVEADFAQGADTKFKTFWVTGCEIDEPPVVEEEPPVVEEEPPGFEEEPEVDSTDEVEVLGTVTNPAPAVAAAQLPRTGAGVEWALGLGSTLVGAGYGLRTAAGRLRRNA